MRVRFAIPGLLALLVASWLLADRGRAIPAFARKHEFSCTTCHDPFPRLKEYGNDFAGNAFAPSDQEMPPRYFRDVGDEHLSLFKELPLAVRADLFFDFQADSAKGKGMTDFKVPFGLKLLSGGRLAENIGYYFYFYMNEAGEVAGVEDAYIHFHDLFGSGLDLMIGQFQVSDPMFKRELRLTFEDYQLYKIKPGLSRTDLTYDRGLILSYGFDFGLDVVGMIVNGSGKGEADLEGDFDADRYKTYLVHLSQTLGPVRLGLLGFWGKEEQEVPDVGPDGEQILARRANEVLQWGPDLTLSLGRAEINAQYLQRRDINPEFRPANEPTATVTHAFLVEAVANLMGDPGVLYAVLLFNLVDGDAVDEAGQAVREETYTANLTYLIRRNIKTLVEYTFAPFRHGAEVNEHRVTLGLVGAF